MKSMMRMYSADALHCGSEVQVDLQEILSDGDSDLFGTAVLCENCTRRMMGGEPDGNQ